jgi:tetratricopeptide (TPR) repeat protein
LLVASHVAGAPDFYHGREPKVAVRISFDPELVELRRVSEYKLWVRTDSNASEGAGTWTQVGKTKPREQPIYFEAPDEGRYGLRASVVYENGQELFQPLGADEPQLWFVFDQTPPKLTWSDARGRRALGRKPTLELAWVADERQFGRAPVKLTYSLDDGQSWKPIAEKPARFGKDKLSWNVPREVSGAVLVRLSATDLAGNSSHEDLGLRYARGAILPASDADVVLEGKGGIVASAPKNDGDVKDGATRHGEKGDGDNEPDGDATELADAPTAEGAANDTDSDDTDSDDTDSDDTDSDDTGADDTGSDEPRALVRLVPLESTCLRGGTELAVRWETDDADLEKDPKLLERTALLEYSFDAPGSADVEWMLAAEAAVGAMGVPWIVPASTGDGLRLRLFVDGDEDGSTDTIDGLSIDATAPIVACDKVPEQAGGRLSLTIQGEDVGCSELDGVLAFVRKNGEEFWAPIDESASTWNVASGRVTLDLRKLPGATYDVYLAGRDALGNTAATPGAATKPMGTFALDTTPPTITAEMPVIDWVGGFETTIAVQFDLDDVTPPLVVEAREPDGDWREIHRLASLTGAREGLSVVLPVEVRELELRVRVTDSLGNEGTTTLGPREVRAPLVFTTIQEGAQLRPFSTESVAWTLHPAAAEIRDELRILVAYRLGAEGDWKQIYDKVPAGDGFDWVLPDGDIGAATDLAAPAAAGTVLRARLYRGTEMVGQVVSASFAIASFLKPVAISDVSMDAFEKGKSSETIYRLRRDERIADGATSDGSELSTTEANELSRFASEAQASYRNALELDANNHHASYALAMLLNDLDSSANAGEVASQLEKTIKVQPEHASALINLGAVAIQSGNFERARRALERAVQVKDSPLARFNLGLSLIFLEEPAEARGHFAKALEKDASRLAASAGDPAAPSVIPIGDAWFYTVYSYILEGDLGTARAVYRDHQDLIPAELKSVIEKELDG